MCRASATILPGLAERRLTHAGQFPCKPAAAPGGSHTRAARRVSAEDGGDAHPAVRAVLRGAQGPRLRSFAAAARRGRRVRLPGDVPASAARLSEADERAAPAR